MPLSSLEKLVGNRNLPIGLKLLRLLDPKSLKSLGDASSFLEQAMPKYPTFVMKTMVLRDSCRLNKADQIVLRLIYPIVTWLSSYAAKEDYQQLRNTMIEFGKFNATSSLAWNFTWEYAAAVAWAEGKTSDNHKVKKFLNMDFAKVRASTLNAALRLEDIKSIESCLSCLPSDERRPWLTGTKSVTWKSMACKSRPAVFGPDKSAHRCYSRFGPCHEAPKTTLNKNYTPILPIMVLQHILTAHVQSPNKYNYTLLLVFLEVSNLVNMIETHLLTKLRGKRSSKCWIKNDKTTIPIWLLALAQLAQLGNLISYRLDRELRVRRSLRSRICTKLSKSITGESSIINNVMKTVLEQVQK